VIRKEISVVEFAAAGADSLDEADVTVPIPAQDDRKKRERIAAINPGFLIRAINSYLMFKMTAV